MTNGSFGYGSGMMEGALTRSCLVTKGAPELGLGWYARARPAHRRDDRSLERTRSRHGGGTAHPCVHRLPDICRTRLPAVSQEDDNLMSLDPAPIRILAVDDHPLIRVGIATLVAPESDMKLVGEADAHLFGRKR